MKMLWYSRPDWATGLVVYRDYRDWWVGYYRGDSHHFVCLLPTVVLSWKRKWARTSTPPKAKTKPTRPL